MKKRISLMFQKVSLALALILILSFAAACSQSSDNVDKFPYPNGSVTDGRGEYGIPNTPGFVDDEPAEIPDSGSETGGENDNFSDRKLTRTVNLSMETQEFESLTSKIETEVFVAGGYIQTSSIRGDADAGTRVATYQLRVPADRLSDFLEAVSTEGNVIRESSEVEDITLQYVDTESRLASLRIEQETLMGILESAETIEDIISIQSRLSNLRYEIESYESQMRTMDNQVEYSIVNLDLSEVRTFTQPEVKNFWDEAGRTFSQAWQSLGNGLKTLLLVLIAISPGLIVLAVLVAIILLVIFLVTRKKRLKNRQQKISKSEKPNDLKQ